LVACDPNSKMSFGTQKKTATLDAVSTSTFRERPSNAGIC